ncbi:unnamed protein product [Adineta steineri]|uniref:Fucosyltransferase n=1 Tax=Adineta steineri TaxID=433720 RepID=A0A814VIP1_9BILA|nr:unnamed protein product [Adineta steineri]CAF1189521.1 unnamed protein product [Adineta steineri]CAF1195045.1 unnamed protein product [Adineta steineri]
MIRNFLCLKQKRTLFLLIISLIIFFFYYNIHLKSQQQQLFIPRLRINHEKLLNQNLTFKKVSIAYYTTSYLIRTDSHTKIFNKNLEEICEILDPEDYPLADSVFVNIVDFTRFPKSYRHLHQSQLWIFHSEESPRNSYRTVNMKNIVELDDWFNLTSTFRPESDFHIKYRGYRIKPNIGKLLQVKLNINLNQTIYSTSDIFHNTSSIYLNTLSSILHRELLNRQNVLLNICPYTCNQPLPSHAIQALQPYLNEIKPKVLNRNIVYIAWFVSNCDTHSRREDYVNKLRSQKGIHIDIYGNCKSMYHSHIIPIQCQKGTPNCTEKTISNYRFYLSFENSKCDTYITEKYWIQGTNGYAIPIVLGAKKEQYERIVVPNSYIHVDDFLTVEDLANELHRLNQNDTEFMKYLQWTQLYDVSVDYSPASIIDMHSTLCFLGHYQYLHSMKEENQQITYGMKTIRNIFHMTNMHLSNFNWTTAKTNLIRISQFYNPTVNCWDMDYPSILKQIYNHLFTWWKLF